MREDLRSKGSCDVVDMEVAVLLYSYLGSVIDVPLEVC